MTRIDNSVVIDAPLDRVWDMTNDVTTWPELFSEYESVEILGTDGDTVTFRLTLRPDENGQRWSWISERTPDRSTYEVTARRLETGPFTYMNIRWTYERTTAGVLLRWEQDFAVRPGLPFGDEEMAERLTTNTRREMARIAGIIESLGVSAAVAT